jgi:oxygen-dependent protoporphyrinogen oxidase
VDALVIGAGISGLAAARALARAGRAVLLIESGAAVGGTMRTLNGEGLDGYRVEAGPNTVQDSPELRELARDAGCEDGLIPASPLARKRYLVHRGRLAALPSGPPGLLTTRLLSPAAKLRLAGEPWRPPLPETAETSAREESVADFFRRRLGPQVLERFGDAMVLGVYAGDPEELAIGYAFRRVHALEREHGSLLRGLRKAAAAGIKPPGLVSFQGGLGAFAVRLAQGLEVETGWRAERVRTDATGGGFRVVAVRDEQRYEVTVPRLVTALPAAETAELLAPLGDTEAFQRIPHAPVAVVALGYPRERVAHRLDGFGFLVPHGENRPLLGCIFTSTLFPGTAPEGHVLLTAMVGGRRRPNLLDLNDGGLWSLVHGELAQLLGIQGEPAFQRVVRWQPGIPQPTAAWAEVSRQAAALEQAHPGLTILGNWLHGVGVPDCVRAGWSVR